MCEILFAHSHFIVVIQLIYVWMSEAESRLMRLFLVDVCYSFHLSVFFFTRFFFIMSCFLSRFHHADVNCNMNV